MIYRVKLQEEDTGHEATSIAVVTGTNAREALHKAREIAHEGGYMPEGITGWERVGDEMTTTLKCR